MMIKLESKVVLLLVFQLFLIIMSVDAKKQGSFTFSTNCKDRYPQCVSWSKYCQDGTFGYYMQTTCPVTCNVCKESVSPTSVLSKLLKRQHKVDESGDGS